MTEEPSISDVMEAYAADAVDLAEKNFRKQLDFSPDSLKTVEFILQQLHATIPSNFFQRLFRKAPSEKQVVTMAKIFGGYMGETIRRAHGGHWELFDMKGADTVSLRVGEANIFPVARAYKRIRQGSEENVYDYYRMLANDFVQKAP